MNIEKKLKKLGIIQKNKIKPEERNYISKNIADMMTKNIQELSMGYNELYMRIFNCNMYYAELKEEYNGVFYFYQNNTIYVKESKESININQFLIHEIIHYLQNFEKVIYGKDNKRTGVCKFTDFKIWGLGINEAIVQYIVSKTMGNNEQRINGEKITFCTNSDKYYKYMTSLIIQIMFFIGKDKAINSCITSSQDFEDDLYNTFEENTDKILKNFDIILAENNKRKKNENKIINIYMQTQKLIYEKYFNNACKFANETKEVDNEVQRLQDYEKIVGRFYDDSKDPFMIYKNQIESDLFRKYIEINKNQNQNSLIIVYKNSIYEVWNKIHNFIQNKIIKSKQ